MPFHIVSVEVLAGIRRGIAIRYSWSGDIEDLQQEGLIAAGMAKPGCENVAAMRQCVDYLRKLYPRSRAGYAPKFSELRDYPSGVRTALDGMIESKTLIALHMAVNELPKTERAVIHSTYWLGQNQQTIVDRVGEPVKDGRAITVYKRAAIARLREAMSTNPDAAANTRKL